ncbi:MAG: type II toxin-antitoxin system VapC family toxin [Desulfobacteraceae bacterium]|nr:MAG: type II toxin-antitoxin system VapC family toxin [Desulfobacteraceae bacterium]
MKYLLDTNICVYWRKGNDHIEQKILSGGIDNILVSFITASELYYGAYKSERVDENLAMIRNLIDHINVIESDDAISEAFGKLKASLEKAGMIIDDADLFIAACALVHGLTVVTNNTKHFKRIEDLKLDNWI